MRRSHRLDMLPLLDVFMVVLFVFATIQETKLDETTRAASQENERARMLEDRLRTTEAELVAERNTQLAAEATAEAADLRRKLEDARRELEQVRESAKAVGAGDEAVRRVNVLTRLLDRYAVFEIEVAGELDDAGLVHNRCCYRDDPLVDTWKTCGTVPTLKGDREAWFEAGADGLVAGLQRTQGDSALTIVRQNDLASFGIAGLMVDLVRTRLPEHHVSDEGVALMKMHCAN